MGTGTNLWVKVQPDNVTLPRLVPQVTYLDKHMHPYTLIDDAVMWW